MNRRWEAGWLMAGALSIFLFQVRTVTASGFWMHMAAGRWISRNGIPDQDPFSWWLAGADTRWIEAHWFSDLLLYWLGQGLGLPGLQVVSALLLSLGSILIVRAVHRRATVEDQALALLLGAWVMAPAMSPGPAVFAAPVMGAFLLVLSRTRAWRLPHLGLLLGLQVVWTQLSPSFLLGPIAAAFLWIRPSTRTLTRGLAGTLLLAGVTLVNPYGCRLHIDLFQQMTDLNRQVVLEWISPFHEEFLPDPTRYLSTLYLVLMAVPLIASKRRLPRHLVPGAMISAFILVRSFHHPVEAGLFGLPMVALGIHHVLRHARRLTVQGRILLPRRSRLLLTGLVILATGLAILSNRYYRRIGHTTSFGLGVEQGLFPSDACLARLDALPPESRLGNLAHDGGYLLWKRPGRKIFTDPRGHLYGQAFYGDLYRGLGGEEAAWKDLNDRGTFSAILLPASWLGSGRVIHLLLLTPLWELVYFDGTSALLLRRTSENEDVMNHFADNGSLALRAAIETVEQTPAYTWRKPPFPIQVTAAARVYQAAGEYERSRSLYPLVLAQLPRMAGAWYDLGVACAKTVEHDAAIALLQRYTDRFPQVTRGWLWLGKAYEQAGQPENANDAYAMAGKLNEGLTRNFRQGLEPMSAHP
ncbi:MAG: tetratricopeptide repeat protein [Kiritimatiellae bacterium]|nr:tetratricopeptide repeat protein [Kiritimatiellia bacterium]